MELRGQRVAFHQLLLQLFWAMAWGRAEVPLVRGPCRELMISVSSFISRLKYMPGLQLWAGTVFSVVRARIYWVTSLVSFLFVSFPQGWLFSRHQSFKISFEILLRGFQTLPPLSCFSSRVGVGGHSIVDSTLVLEGHKHFRCINCGRWKK